MNLMFDGGELERLRKSRGLTQPDVARLAGVHVKTIERAEGGKVIRISNMRRIAKALKTPLTDIAHVVE